MVPVLFFLFPSSLIALSHSLSLYHPIFSHGGGAWEFVIGTYRQQMRLNDGPTLPPPLLLPCVAELFDLSDPGAIPSMGCKSSQAYTSGLMGTVRITVETGNY